MRAEKYGRASMIANKVSVIIPSYRDPHLARTIESVLAAAKEPIEIIVYLDHFVPSELKRDNRVLYLMSLENVGMRRAINESVKISSGEYIMKLDSHCGIIDGFDVILKSQTEKDWVSIPAKYNLNVDTWERDKGPVTYLYLEYPSLKKEKIFRMKPFNKKIKKRNNPMIDDIIAFQGACWFMYREFFDKIGGLNEELFGSFGAEAHEISMKTWLTTDNGRVVINKNAWYAHYRPEKIWKNKPDNLKTVMVQSMKKVFQLDMLNQWPNQKRPFKWVIDKFGPFPKWPIDWHTDEYINKLKQNLHV